MMCPEPRLCTPESQACALGRGRCDVLPQPVVSGPPSSVRAARFQFPVPRGWVPCGPLPRPLTRMTNRPCESSSLGSGLTSRHTFPQEPPRANEQVSRGPEALKRLANWAGGRLGLRISTQRPSPFTFDQIHLGRRHIWTLYIKRFIVSIWLTWLRRLKSPKTCRREAGRQGVGTDAPARRQAHRHRAFSLHLSALCRLSTD